MDKNKDLNQKENTGVVNNPAILVKSTQLPVKVEFSKYQGVSEDSLEYNKKDGRK